MARGAGRIVQTHFGEKFDIQFKSDNQTDPVSEVDKESEEYLKKAIGKHFPEHGVLGEEGTDVNLGRVSFLWALDPLDGTVNYINGLPIYSVSIGVLHRGTPVVGCIWVPSPSDKDGLVYHSSLGSGAHVRGRPISVRENSTPQKGQLAVMPLVFRQMIRKRMGRGTEFGEIRGPGSIAYEMAMVASGAIQYALFASPRLWDVAAGVVLVREAGGAALTYSQKYNRWEDLGPIPILQSDNEGETGDLRKWSSPIMVGNRDLIEYLGEGLRPTWLGRLTARLKL